MYVCMCVCMYVLYICVFVCMHVYVCVYVCIYITVVYSLFCPGARKTRQTTAPTFVKFCTDPHYDTVSIPVNVRNILTTTGMAVIRNFGGIAKRVCQFEMFRILKDSAAQNKSTACIYVCMYVYMYVCMYVLCVCMCFFKLMKHAPLPMVILHVIGTQLD